jgi:hypothetical protein
MLILYCLFTIKPSTSSRLLYTLPPGTTQFETNIATKINSNKDDTDSEKEKLKMRTHCLNFINKGAGEAYS